MPDDVQRNVLPIPDQTHVGLTTYDAKDPDTKFPPIEPLRPPQGAPNVLVILIDDCGFGASSAFGGPVNTPNAPFKGIINLDVLDSTPDWVPYTPTKAAAGAPLEFAQRR